MILLSYSGETAEVVDLALILKADRVPTIGICKDAGTRSSSRITLVVCRPPVLAPDPSEMSDTSRPVRPRRR